MGRSLGYSGYRPAGVPRHLPENATFLETIWVAVRIQMDDRSTPFTVRPIRETEPSHWELGPWENTVLGTYILVYKIFDF